MERKKKKKNVLSVKTTVICVGYEKGFGLSKVS